MTFPASTAAGSLTQLLASWRKHVRLLIAPVVVCTLLAGGFAALRPREWPASQSLLVRDEAAGALRQGRFDNNEAMKTAQETIAEICRNQALLAAALSAVGPPGGKPTAGWPRPADIESLQRELTLTAPKGQEFGRSEVIYLAVAAETAGRASELVSAVCDQLETRLKELRDRKAQSIVAELEKTAALAERDLDAATRELAALEAEVGSDLGELRILNDSAAGDSNLRTLHTQVRNELRQARVAQESHEEQLRLLAEAEQSPDALLAAPKAMLDSHPALRRLKDGLVDAQLRTAQLRGKMSADHPEVRAAVTAEDAIRRQLRDELALVVGGLKADLKVSQSQSDSLDKQLADVEQRLNRLAALRASYANLVAQSRQRSETLQRTQQELAEARARQAAARSASLITRLDRPVAGNEPLGPGALTLIGAGAFGGLAIGVALMFLIAPIESLRGRRWTDLLPRGRRSSDRSWFGRRTTDRTLANPAAALPPGENRRSGEDRRSGSAEAPKPARKE
jgi:uncharacterized protein involved in exopolysaccharide biosynthesis